MPRRWQDNIDPFDSAMKTMVLGASPKPYRYSHRVTLMLQQNGFKVIPIGIHTGNIGGQPIIDLTEKPYFADLHTITVYLNSINQRSWWQYILELKPQRVIFNPGSENPELYKLLSTAGINNEEACTLVMLATGNFNLT